MKPSLSGVWWLWKYSIIADAKCCLPGSHAVSYTIFVAYNFHRVVTEVCGCCYGNLPWELLCILQAGILSALSLTFAQNWDLQLPWLTSNDIISIIMPYSWHAVIRTTRHFLIYESKLKPDFPRMKTMMVVWWKVICRPEFGGLQQQQLPALIHVTH